MRIAHVVNYYAAPAGHELTVAQPITFASMRRAREVAATRGVEVTLVGIGYPEDGAAAPDDFVIAPHLTRSLMDLGTFARPRKLPLLSDILAGLEPFADADLWVYTNADIGVLPTFYEALAAFHREGRDAIVVNRRSIDARFNHVEQLPQMYAEVGRRHGGWDCFAFVPALYGGFDLGDIVIGLPRIGRTMLWNLAATATRLEVFEDLHLTFHIGADARWAGPDYRDQAAANTAASEAVRARLEAAYGLSSVPAAQPYLKTQSLIPVKRLRRPIRRLRRALRGKRP